MKYNRQTLVCLLVLLLFSDCNCINAQRNFYHRIDVGSSNIYTFVGSNLITGYANYFTHDILFDNSYTYTFLNGSYQGQDIKTKALDLMGLTAQELFSDCFAGVKLGYQTDNMGSLNWGVYGSAHYKINQFNALFPFMNDYYKECIQYFKPGIGLFFTFGSVESKTKIQVEAAIRYDLPIGYKGVFGKKTDALSNGVSSHFAIKIAGYTWLSAGLYADINHYNFYKEFKQIGNSKFKMFNLGITFTITPKRGEDLYD